MILAVRTAKGAAAASSIPGDRVRRLDLADLASVRAFADGWNGDVDLLINNAGVMALPESRPPTASRVQSAPTTSGTSRSRHLLLERVTGRVVLSSGAHRAGSIRLDDLNWGAATTPLAGLRPVKLANLLFTAELQRRLGRGGRLAGPIAAAPTRATPRRTCSSTPGASSRPLMRVGNMLIAQSDEMGALPTLYAATADIPGNTYVGPSGFQEARGTRRSSTAVPGEGRPRRPPAVGPLRAAHGRQLPLPTTRPLPLAFPGRHRLSACRCRGRAGCRE